MLRKIHLSRKLVKTAFKMFNRLTERCSVRRNRRFIVALKPAT